MLTLEETRLSLKAFKIFSILNIFPIEVDVKTGKIQKQSKKVKVLIWRILFGIGASHWLFMFGRLVQSTLIDREKYFRWDHFVFHFPLTCCSTINYLAGFRLFLKNEEETVMIFNQLFAEREDPVQKMMDREKVQIQKELRNGNGKQGNKTRVKFPTLSTSKSAAEPEVEIEVEVIGNKSEFASQVRPRPLLTYSPDELLAIVHVLLMPFTVVIFVLFFSTDPTRPHLLYSALPSGWQNLWSFLVLLAVETLAMAVSFFTGSFFVVTQVLFFGKCQLEFKRLSLQLRNLQERFQIDSLEVKREIWILRQISMEIRELVVLIELFNRCFPLCIFAWKICCLSISIVCYFFVIRHSDHFPFLASFVNYGGVVHTSTYTVMYEKAFSIPGKMDELKNEFLLTAQKAKSKSVNKTLWPEMKREMKRIPNVGIKVGSFHQMERESTPSFVDFVVNQVVSLLVTFPR